MSLFGVVTLQGCKSDDPQQAAAGGSAGEGPDSSEGGMPTKPEAGAAGEGPEAMGGAGAGLPLDRPCDTPAGKGTTHGLFVSKDETWTFAGSPYLVPDGLSIDATLTLEPCTVVRVGAGKDILVGGKLLGKGRVDDTGDIAQYTFIQPLDDAPWGAIKSTAAGGEIDLNTAWVEGGGAVPAGTQPQQTGMIVVEGERGLELAPRLTLFDVYLIGSASQGVVLTNNAAFGEPGLISAVKNAGYPVLVGSRAAGTVPDLLVQDNGHEAVLIGISERLGDGVPSDVVLRKLNIPYRIGTDLDTGVLEVGTGNGNAATLTIEAGTQLLFPELGGISVEGPDGTLIATGTANAPVVFTSDAAKPMAGDWLGLNFTGKVAAKTSLKYVEVAYAGNANTGARSFSCGTPPAPAMDQAETMGAVYLSLDEAPAGRFLSNSVLRDSASNGVDRGYTGAEVDFAATNTFENIAFCLQTTPKPAVGACPAKPTCQLP